MWVAKEWVILHVNKYPGTTAGACAAETPQGWYCHASTPTTLSQSCSM